MQTVLNVMLGSGLGLVACYALAADPEISADAGEPVDQIVVVAHKSERSIRDVAATVTVLSQSQLRLELATSMADMLRYSPGIDFEGAGTRFGTEGINLRGVGGNRVALLVDGVPLGDQFDVGSFSNATRDFVNAGFIHQAEILHGPASAIYGSAAIGGVVAMRSPDPTDLSHDGQLGGNLTTVWRGDDSSLHATALQSVLSGNIGALLGISVRDGSELDAAGTNENLDTRNYKRRSALLKFVATDARGDTWRFGYFGQDSTVLSSLNSMLGSGRFRSTTALNGDDAARMDMLLGEYQFAAGTSWIDDGVIRAYFSDTDVHQQTLDERGLAARPVSIDRLFDFAQTIKGVELNLQKSIIAGVAAHQLGFGIELRERRTEEYRDALETGLQDGLQTNVLLGEVFPLRDFPISDSTELGVYVEDTVSVGQWSIVGGLRADRYELDPVNDPIYAADYPFATPVALSESEISPKLGIVYQPRESLDIYLQYSHGFRAPPYEDANIGLELPVFNVRAIPNPDLKSETSDGIDVGIRWRADSASLFLSAFHTRYDDFIESKVRLGADPDSGRILFQSQNLSEATIEGIEAGGTLAFERDAGTLAVDWSLYWARGENRDNGQPLNSVGPPQAVIGIDWAPAGGHWHARLRSTITDGWSERDETRGELFSPPGHAVFDLYLTRHFGKRVTVRAGVTNLTDRTYWTWSDVRWLSPDEPVIPYLANPGTSIVLGADMNW